MSVPYRDEESGLMLLDPIEYLPAPEGGWIVPDDERERWDNPPHSGSSAPKPRSLLAIIASLSRLFYLDERSETLLCEKYELNDLAVSYMTAEVERSCEQGALRNPAGLLAKRLREITKGRDDS